MNRTFNLFTKEQYDEICEQVKSDVKNSIIAKTLSQKFNRTYNSVYQQIMNIKKGKTRTTFAPNKTVVKSTVKPAKIEVRRKSKEASQAAIDIADMKDCMLSFTPKKVELFNDRCIMYF